MELAREMPISTNKTLAEVIPMPLPEQESFTPLSIKDTSLSDEVLAGRIFDTLRPHVIKKLDNEATRSIFITHEILIAIEALPTGSSDEMQYSAETLLESASKELQAAQKELPTPQFREMMSDLAESLEGIAEDTNLYRAAALCRKRLSSVLPNEVVKSQQLVYLLLDKEFNQR